MQVITQNTEERLLETLKNCWEANPTHRCLQLKFSQVEEDVHEWLELLCHELRTQLDDQALEIYLCQDQDVFILTRILTQKGVEDFFAHIAPRLTPALSSPGLACLFEIGVDWPKLRQICEKKIEAIALARSLREQKKKEELEKIGKKEALKALSKDLIKSLASRRCNRNKPEIMIVEDDPFSQKMVRSALKSKYPLSMSGDGAGALMSYVNKAPDVLFLDIGLPDINGHEVLKRLFKIDPDAYVVMFSGNGDKENVLKAVELGAKGFVGKPFSKEKLIAYIEKSPFIQEKKNRESAHGNLVH